MADFATLVLGADTEGLKTALSDLLKLDKASEKTEQSAISLNKGLIALGAAAAGLATVMAVGVKRSIDTADSYSKLSQRLGIAIKDLGALSHMANLSGASIDSLAVGVQFLSRNLANALEDPTGAAAKSLKSLGISATDAAGNLKEPLGVLGELSDKFAAMPDGAQKTALAMDLVGRGGAALIPLLNGGSEAFEDMRKEAEALGLVMSEETARDAELFNDNLDRITSGLTGVFNIIAAKVLPALASLTTDLVAATKDGVKFFSDNVDTFAGVLEHGLIAATALATFMAGQFVVSVGTSAVAAVSAAVSQMVALEMALGATSVSAALTSVAIKGFSLALTTLKGALIATGVGALVVGAGELIALLVELKTKTGSWGEAFALVGGVIKGVLMDAWSNFSNLVGILPTTLMGLVQAVKAAVSGGDISDAFLEEFNKVKFGAENTLAAVAALNAAMKNESAPNTGGGDSGGKGKPPPNTGPAGAILEKYDELTKKLKDQIAMLGMSERAAAVYAAQLELAAGSSQKMKDAVGELAGKLFDDTKLTDAAKETKQTYKDTVEELQRSIQGQMNALVLSDEEQAVSIALDKVKGKLTDDMKRKLTDLARTEATLTKNIKDRNTQEEKAKAVKRELMTAQDKLNEAIKEYGLLLSGGFINQSEFDKIIAKVKKDLNIDTRPIGQQLWDGFKATFFGPFDQATQEMADKFADKVNSMSQALSSMKGGSTLDKIQGGLNALAYVPGIGPYAAAISKAITVVKSVVSIVKSIGSVLFGGKWETTGGGIQLSLGAGGVMGQSFEEQFKKGGLLSSSKNRTIYSGISGDQQSQFDTAYQAILNNATAAFKLFGVEASQSIMEAVQIAGLNIKTSGEGALSESEAKAAIENWFKQLDEAVVLAVGGESVQALLDFATDGESATETLIRLGNQLQTVNTLLSVVDKNAYAVSISGGVLAEKLVSLTGGIDAFKSGISSFYENFYSEEEKFDKLSAGLTKTFTDLGLTLPATRGGIRAIVDGLDLTTEAGQKAFAAILGSSDALAAYYTTLETKAKEATDAATAANEQAAEVAKKAAEEAARLNAQLGNTNAVLTDLGLTLFDASDAGKAAADALVQLAGGFDALQSGARNFYQNFYTDGEKFSDLTGSLTKTFTDLGLTLPTTREGVRAIVDGLDLTTESGRKALAAILTASGQLDSYYDILEGRAKDAAAAAKAEADAVAKAAADAAALLAKQIADNIKAAQDATDDALQALTDSVNQEKELKRAAYEENIRLIQEESDAKRDAANIALGAAQDNLRAIQGEVDQVLSALGSAQAAINPDAERTRAIELIKAALRSGDLAGTGAAAQVAMNINPNNFATAADFRREQARTLNLLGALGDAGQVQIDYAQLTVKRLEDEIKAIEASTQELIDAETALYEAQIAVLDETLLNAQNQYNELRSINTGIYSVEDALRTFINRIDTERTTSFTPPKMSVESDDTLVGMAGSLEVIAAASRATATATTKSYNLSDREYREAQGKVTV